MTAVPRNWLCCLLLALVCGALHAAPASVGAAPAAAPIPFKQDRAVSGTDTPRLAAGLILVLLAAAGGLYVLRAKLRAVPTASRLLQVLETRRLTPRSSLHVVEFGGAQYLLAHSEQGVVCLASKASPGPAPAMTEGA